MYDCTIFIYTSWYRCVHEQWTFAISKSEYLFSNFGVYSTAVDQQRSRFDRLQDPVSTVETLHDVTAVRKHRYDGIRLFGHFRWVVGNYGSGFLDLQRGFGENVVNHDVLALE